MSKTPEPFHFFAYVSRMKFIERWSLMRCTQPENVQEHSLQVAVVAHALAVVKNKYFEGRLNPDRVALAAIFHDATEVMTGDLPTPVKYFNPEMRTAYQAIEGHAVEQLLSLLPDDLREDYRGLLSLPDDQQDMHDIIKAADSICAYIKCLEEEVAGNHEFSRAKKTIGAKVRSLCERPEVDYFVKHFVPSFALTLDEISRPFERQ